MTRLVKAQPVVDTTNVDVEETSRNGVVESISWTGTGWSANAGLRTTGQWKVLVYIGNEEVSKYRADAAPTTEEITWDVEHAAKLRGYAEDMAGLVADAIAK